jgi:hypothetical protein
VSAHRAAGEHGVTYDTVRLTVEHMEFVKTD